MHDARQNPRRPKFKVGARIDRLDDEDILRLNQAVLLRQ
jgi:hypothetical protein